jgi:hypothetical protein
MTYVWFFLGALWYTLGAILICGTAVSLCRFLFLRMMGRGFGRGVVMATSALGTPIHELGHALMCLLFGHRITEMSLWQPGSEDGNLGYVTHAYKKKNPYQVLGNLFIAVGPVFSGLAVITLALRLGFPEAFSAYTSSASALASSGEGGLSLIREGLSMLPRMVGELTDAGRTVSLWGQIIALVVVLAVSQHISLSPADIKGGAVALPLYGLLILLLTAVCGLLGSSAMEAVTAALRLFSGYMTALFTVVLVASVLQLILALPVWLIRLLIRRE